MSVKPESNFCCYFNYLTILKQKLSWSDSKYLSHRIQFCFILEFDVIN